MAMAEKRFEVSCALCCSQGKRLSCERCGIYEAHKAMKMILERKSKQVG
jgi:hypothetical protein